mgnify:CR=1 FL=1
MPIYLLTDNLIFPPINGAEDGIVAIGGDLSVERLLVAYKSGIFPWYSENEPIVWHAPEQRFVLMLSQIHISKSMHRVLNSNKFKITFDENFEFVINQCANITRKDQQGTWILPEMINAYTELHKKGYAHSVEIWKEDTIVGGLYGVSIGRCFFAESMFHTESNASKFALIKLSAFLKQHNFTFLDAQVFSEHVATMGAHEIPRNEFMNLLKDELNYPSLIGKWSV